MTTTARTTWTIIHSAVPFDPRPLQIAVGAAVGVSPEEVIVFNYLDHVRKRFTDQIAAYAEIFPKDEPDPVWGTGSTLPFAAAIGVDVNRLPQLAPAARRLADGLGTGLLLQDFYTPGALDHWLYAQPGEAPIEVEIDEGADLAGYVALSAESRAKVEALVRAA